jgi:AbrB family looped-hinge helix DNA binding protein
MTVAKVTVKGQVLIPVEYRKKFGIPAPGQVVVMEKDGQLVILPLPQDPINDARGMLKGKYPLDVEHKKYKDEEISMEDIDD